jgi:hypothetical protein
LRYLSGKDVVLFVDCQLIVGEGKTCHSPEILLFPVVRVSLRSKKFILESQTLKNSCFGFGIKVENKRCCGKMALVLKKIKKNAVITLITAFFCVV